MKSLLFLLLFTCYWCLTTIAFASDPFMPGWSGKYMHGVGYSTSLVGTSTFIYDHYTDSPVSYTGLLGYSKSSSNSLVSTSDNTTTVVESNTGSKSIGTYTLAGSYNYRIYRNEWTNLRAGFLFGTNIFTSVKYPTGTKTTTTATGVVTYSSYGTVESKKGIQPFLGPTFYSGINLRWFPMITMGMDGGIFYYFKTNQTTTTTTNNAGVTTTTVAVTSTGENASTLGLGTFGFQTAFSVRYVW